MGLIEKVNYTLNAVNDISLALKEKNINIGPVVLKDYGDIIRILKKEIQPGNTLNGVRAIVKEKYMSENTPVLVSKTNLLSIENLTLIRTGYSGVHLIPIISNSFSKIEEEK